MSEEKKSKNPGGARHRPNPRAEQAREEHQAGADAGLPPGQDMTKSAERAEKRSRVDEKSPGKMKPNKVEGPGEHRDFGFYHPMQLRRAEAHKPLKDGRTY